MTTGPDAPASPPGDDPLRGLVVPDDASALAFEAEALRRERAARRRRERAARVLRTRRWQRYGLSGPLVAGVLVLVALVGSLMVLLGPRPPARLAAAPLASGSGEGPVLPGVPLRAGPRTVPADALRPAVVALVPAGCGCAESAEQVVGQAWSFRLPTHVVAAPGAEAELEALRASRRVRAQGFAVDTTGGLTARFDAHPARPTLLLVRADGVVTHVVRGFAPDQRLEVELRKTAVASGLAAA